MTYAEILAAVNSLTGQGGALPDQTEKMIQAATLRMHQSDFYSRDLSENSFDLGSDGFLFSFDATATFARFRALHYLRHYDPTTDTRGQIYEKADPLHILDAYGREITNIWYNAGKNVVLKTSGSVRFVMAGWYQLPVISPINNYASWIAETVPHAIIFDACSLIFQMLSQQEKSRKFDTLVAEQLQMVKMHGLDAHGR